VLATALLAGAVLLQDGEVPAFGSVYLVFADEHAASFVSGFGHVFVCLPDEEITSVDQLLAETALNFGADMGPMGQGSSVGNYRLQPCHELVRKNIFFDQRRVTFFELSVPESSLEDLRADLQTRLRGPHPYGFLRRNCGYYVWDWLDGPDRSPSTHLYLTPRDTVSGILEQYPARSVLVMPSHVEVLQAYLQRAPLEARPTVLRGLWKPERLLDLADRTLRLLALDVAESRATRETYSAVQEVRRRTLEEPHGTFAAQRALAFQEEVAQALRRDWPGDAEGPAASVGVFHDGESDEAGVRLHAEAGIRDVHSLPCAEEVLREIEFLSLTVDVDSGESRADLVLASIGMTREFHSLNRGTSNGAAVGYAGLPDARGTKGAYAQAWIGVDDRTPAGWLGGRVTLVADELQDEADLRALPGASWRYLGTRFAGHLEVHHDFDAETGWRLQQDLLWSDTLTLSASWTRTPQGEDLVAVVLQTRL
jgi:hypothetical protein